MKGKLILFLLLYTNYINQSVGQPNTLEYSILFYNVENLFAPGDEPVLDDDNFTPQGDLHWTNKRLNEKLLKLSKVILSASDWKTTDIVVFAEIETRNILEKLVKDTPLKIFPYKIIHKESPDNRGIDVGMIYHSEHFYPLEYQYYPLVINDKPVNTREILYVMGVFNEADTVHIFGNHWPSRYSGLLETKSLRKSAALLLKSKIDELNKKYKWPKIVVVGDFNDNPDDESIKEYLSAKKVERPIIEKQLYNLFFDYSTANSGTLKFQSQWFVFDQIIVSGALLSAKKGIQTNPENAKIITLPFLLEKDEKYGGLKPFRTYYGYSYNGGFSDHLPVLLQLKIAN